MPSSAIKCDERVEEPNINIIPPESAIQTIARHATLTWTVEVEGKPAPLVNWYKNKTQVAEDVDSRIKITRSSTHSVFTITDPNKNDTGEKQ